MRPFIISVASFAICAASTFAVDAQVPDRVNDLVQQARNLAKSAQDSPTTHQNPFSRTTNSGVGVGIQNANPGSPAGVDISDAAINLNVGGQQITIPRTGTNAVDPTTGHSALNQGDYARQARTGVTINGQRIGGGYPSNTVAIDPAGDVTINRNGSTISTAAYRHFAAGMEAFGKSDYRAAAGHLEKCVAANPDDPMPRPFYSLALFANGNYEQAAEFAYSAAASSPVWDWNQLRSFYADPRQYAAQYEHLQIASRQATASPGTHFLLALHHLMLGHRDVARGELEQVLQRLPNDPIAKNLMDLASQPAISPPEPMR